MSTLQELLNLGLVDIGGDDSRFEKLRAASESVAARLGEDPALLIPATLVALDHDVDEADPIFDFVEELVVAQWKTMRNAHANRPRELLRSVLLDALAAFIEGKPEAAAAVWCTAAGPVRHGQTRLGKESVVVRRLVNEAWKVAEAEAVRRAGWPPPVKPTKRKRVTAKAPTLQVSATVSGTELLQDVARAAGPQHPQGQALQGANPQWPNSGQAWSYQFTPRMSAALAKAVNLGTERLTSSLEKALSSYLGDLEKRVAAQMAKVVEASDATATSIEASRLRLDVLWWSEALYSPTLGCSYRELPLSAAAVASAVDLAAIVPPLAPTSVIYVLGEAMHRVAGLKSGGSIALADYLIGLGDHGSLGDALPVMSRAGRRPLLDLVCDGVAGNAPARAEIHARSGLDAEIQLNAADFAMWVFRDLQARRLVEELR